MEGQLDDELEVLCAILEDDIKIADDKKSCEITVVIKLDESLIVGDDKREVVVLHLPPVILKVALPTGYPELQSPGMLLSSDTAGHSATQNIFPT